MRSQLAREWLTTNEPLFDTIAALVHSVAPETYARYKEIADSRLPIKLGGIFGCCAINFDNGAMDVHRDRDDYTDGFCCVVNYGNFREGGGVLYFPDLNIRVHFN